MVTWSQVFAVACTRRRCGALPDEFCGCGKECTAGGSTRAAEAIGGSGWRAAASGGDTTGGEEEGCDWPASAGEAEGVGEEAGGDVPDCGAGAVADSEGRGATLSLLGRCSHVSSL